MDLKTEGLLVLGTGEELDWNKRRIEMEIGRLQNKNKNITN